MTIVLLPEKKLRRLGRHVEWDARSRSFGARHTSAPLVSTKWKRGVPAFDQGDIGMCTCAAMVGCLMTAPFYDCERELGIAEALDLYKQATRLDKIPGHYPPEDTGSSGLAAAKAAQKRGWIATYHHAFALHEILTSLVHGPGILGINWYEGFEAPVGAVAELVVGGDVRGGHEVCLTEIDVEAKRVRGINSWGEEWGDHGYFSMSFDTLDRLLHEQGDYTIPSK